jgi:hypothetical protein
MPTAINIRRVFAKERNIVATIDVIKKTTIIFRALYLSAAPPPRTRTAIVIIAAVEKNKPGLLIPCLIAYRGRNAMIDPQTALCKNDRIAGGITLGSKKRLSGVCRLSDEGAPPPLSLRLQKKEHRHRPAQAEKSSVALAWLIMNIPNTGPSAKERVGAVRK